MANTGRLTLDRMGFSMPVDAPAYPAPPYHYRGARTIALRFETDADAAREVLPAPLELAMPATAIFSFHWYPFSTFGPYREVVLRLLVRHEGKPHTYVQQIFTDTEPPMLAGREVWGFPKKLAAIRFRRERDMVLGTLERPTGIRLASLLMRPERPAALPPASGPSLALRIIPAAEASAERPAVAEIVAADTTHEINESWEGPGSLSFPVHSALDPVDRFPVRRVLQATYMEHDFLLPAGRVVARL